MKIKHHKTIVILINVNQRKRKRNNNYKQIVMMNQEANKRIKLALICLNLRNQYKTNKRLKNNQFKLKIRKSSLKLKINRIN